MTVFSVSERLTGWVADQLAAEDPLGADDLGYHVSMGVVVSPQGNTIVWMFLVTMRSPFLGQPPIGAQIQVPGNMPPEAQVRGLVTKMLGDLRQALDQAKTSMVNAPGLGLNGLPPGLARALKSGPN